MKKAITLTKHSDGTPITINVDNIVVFEDYMLVLSLKYEGQTMKVFVRETHDEIMNLL